MFSLLPRPDHGHLTHGIHVERVYDNYLGDYLGAI